MKNEYREHFPIFKQYPDLVYLDNAATAQRPRQVTERMRIFDETENANPLRGVYDLSVRATEAVETARHTAAAFLGAAEDAEIIFTRNATESLNLVAYSYVRKFLGKGDEILVPITEHHSNFLPWQQAAAAVGAEVKFLYPDEAGRITVEELESKLTERTKLLALAQIGNVYGVRNPVKELAAAAHRAGAVVVVDGAQSVPHGKVDVQDLDCDFFAFSGHKLYGPMGIGVLYGKRDLLEKMDPFLTGGEMIEYVTTEGATWAELPYKFEAGTVNASGAAGLSAAIEYLQAVGFDAIGDQERALVKRIMDGMEELGYIDVIGSKRPEDHCGIVTFMVKDVHPHDVATILDGCGVAIRAGHHCAQPLMKYLKTGATDRASVSFYNTEEDVDRFLEALQSVRRYLGWT